MPYNKGNIDNIDGSALYTKILANFGRGNIDKNTTSGRRVHEVLNWDRHTPPLPGLKKIIK